MTNVAQIVISSPITPLSPHLSSGDQQSSFSLMLRSCDSRNLNLSPFCNTSATSLVMWQPNTEETYGNTTASYVNDIPGPMRSKYPRSMDKKELIHSRTKVLIWFRIYNDNFADRMTSCIMHMKRMLHWSTSILEPLPYWVRL